MQPDWSILYIFSALLPITLITGLLWGLLMGTSKNLSECLKKCFRFLRNASFMLFSFLSSPMQAAQSATNCSTTQYKPYFRFFGGSYIQYGIMTVFIVFIVAILLQCGAQAANLGPCSHINASKLLLTSDRISPFFV